MPTNLDLDDSLIEEEQRLGKHRTAVAQARDWSVFSADPDFQKYARVLPIKLHAARR
jgi:hypothetical protein